ncbi:MULTISPECIES: transporter substrate-binding domain-containing protein [unclassified Bosea (in: a-proteobacteria)]|uniref:transporter substrate-binding domain-containing protein n=1 Tax=unclassified Bosea (in: a-proteobacteria) TaxID=2653178 RepID=UPI000F7654C1|nr:MULTISPECIES: transporter substrate-binding domain-containing protein [unclassified Bosea (in: a-proteobacteria)]AZO80303.1 ABC transporter substrate-binding protein [Bosea sp. Tri-49]RXT23101.1 ABC transporter substrate-binding protein [Bosea sp. Tri-39]RXT38572.1 ABC transporter substrate-binding protein [Bosea sp. Tri-54]
MEFRPDIGQLSPTVREHLAPANLLRAGINLSNFLLVSSRGLQGEPQGVSPDMARTLADLLGTGLRYVPYENPGLLADAAPCDEWDVGLIGAEPQRAEAISFTPAYAEIEATYLVREASPLKEIADVDAQGIRIAVSGRAAYGLWLDRNIRKAELVRSGTLDDSANDFAAKELDALAGLRPRLLKDVEAIPGTRILDGYFMTVQQAIGVPKAKAEAADYLAKFVAAAKESGFVAALIEKHGVQGLSVAR